MKMLSTLSGILLLGIFSATTSAAKLDMKPGLWNLNTSMTSTSGEIEKAMKQMQEQMANMPPAQRKMIEDMMAAQGIGITQEGTETLIKMCISQEQIDKGLLPQDKGCSQEILEQTKNTFKTKFSCTGTPPTSGTGEIVFSSPTAYTGSSTFTTQMNGKKEDMKMTQKGQWLATDCGNIKPLAF